MKEMFKAIGKGIASLIEFVLMMVIWTLWTVVIGAIGLVTALVVTPIAAILTSIKDDMSISEAFVYQVSEQFVIVGELNSWISEEF